MVYHKSDGTSIHILILNLIIRLFANEEMRKLKEKKQKLSPKKLKKKRKKTDNVQRRRNVRKHVKRLTDKNK